MVHVQSWVRATWRWGWWGRILCFQKYSLFSSLLGFSVGILSQALVFVFCRILMYSYIYWSKTVIHNSFIRSANFWTLPYTTSPNHQCVHPSFTAWSSLVGKRSHIADLRPETLSGTSGTFILLVGCVVGWCEVGGWDQMKAVECLHVIGLVRWFGGCFHMYFAIKITKNLNRGRLQWLQRGKDYGW